jgi:hypothetical protein
MAETSADWDYFGLAYAPPELGTEFTIDGTVDSMWRVEMWWYVVAYTAVEINGYFTAAPVLFTMQQRPSMVRQVGQRVKIHASFQGMHSPTGLPLFYVLEVLDG